MTAPPVDRPRAPRRRTIPFRRGLVAVEAAITWLRSLLVSGRRWRWRRISLQHAGIAAGGADHRRADDRRVGAGGGSWSADLAARNAKRAGRPWTPPRSRPTERAVRRAPFEVAITRWLLWSVAAVYIAVHLASRGLLAWPSAIGVACVTFLHAAGRRRARGALGRRLDARAPAGAAELRSLAHFARQLPAAALPDGGVLLAVAHAVNAALISVFTELTSAQSGTLLALTVPALLCRCWSGTGRCAPDAPPSNATSRSPCRSPGAARAGAEDPDAVAAFRAAQGCRTGCRATRRWPARSPSWRSRWSGASCAASTPAPRAACWRQRPCCCWRWRCTRR
jgi:hypothetical protein